jgi:hypothetical protein
VNKRSTSPNKLHQIKTVSIQHLYKKGKNEIGVLSKRERFLIGISLYAAEGTKYDGKFEFTNTNPEMVLFMAAWLREFGCIKESKLRVSLWLHENLDEKGAIFYWSSITKIPASQFQKSFRAKNKLSSRKVRKNIHAFGVCSIRYYDVLMHRRLMGWIGGILSHSWYNDIVSPVAQW